MDFRIDELKIEDINKIMNLMSTVYDELENKDLIKNYKLDYFKNKLEKPNVILGILTSSDELVGLACLDLTHIEFLKHTKEERYVLYELALVDPLYRGRAFQKVLGQVAEEIARDYNIKIMCSLVHKDNYYGNKNMVKLGYQIKNIINNDNLYIKNIDED